jgi:hypothetical protein
VHSGLPDRGLLHVMAAPGERAVKFQISLRAYLILVGYAAGILSIARTVLAFYGLRPYQ